MLQNLHVKNIALIDETEVDFGQGLNILTGETGAGKSILLGSVGLALGGKYSSDLLRNGAENGLVELTFSVDDGQIRQKLEEMDIIPDDGMFPLILHPHFPEEQPLRSRVLQIHKEKVLFAFLHHLKKFLPPFYRSPDILYNILTFLI